MATMNQQKPNFFLYRGASMWPCFQKGDLVEIEPLTGKNKIRIGDCLVWSDKQGRHVVHRVVGLQGGLQTRGDALKQNDCAPPCSSEVLGRVIRRYRWGRPARVAGGPWGILAGIFYRYAGRIDPERDARGGRLARGIRVLSAPLLRPLCSRGRKLELAGQNRLVVWELWGMPLAIKEPANSHWQVAWPWRVFVSGPS